MARTRSKIRTNKPGFATHSWRFDEFYVPVGIGWLVAASFFLRKLQRSIWGHDAENSEGKGKHFQGIKPEIRWVFGSILHLLHLSDLLWIHPCELHHHEIKSSLEFLSFCFGKEDGSCIIESCVGVKLFCADDDDSGVCCSRMCIDFTATKF